MNGDPMNEDDLLRDIMALIESWRQRGVSVDLHVRLVFACSADPAMHPKLLVDDTRLTGPQDENDRRSYRETKTRSGDILWPAGNKAYVEPSERRERLIGEAASMGEAIGIADDHLRARVIDEPLNRH